MSGWAPAPESEAKQVEENLPLRLHGMFRLISPLAHAGDTHGTDVYLSEEVIIGADGRPVECFVYSGNALRGILRDAGSRYLLDRLGVKVPLEVFHILFTGGAISAEAAINIRRSQELREKLPHLSLFGGSLGNRMLAGKMHVGSLYPLCLETQHILPQELRSDCAVSWRQLTTERQFSRGDGRKKAGTARFVETAPGEEELDEKKGHQMIFVVECLAAGARMFGRIDVVGANAVELGALAAALAAWGRKPYLGGRTSMGMGLMEVAWNVVGEGALTTPFVTVTQAGVLLGARATTALAAYERSLDAEIQAAREERDSVGALLASGRLR